MYMVRKKIGTRSQHDEKSNNSASHAQKHMQTMGDLKRKESLFNYLYKRYFLYVAIILFKSVLIMQLLPLFLILSGN